MLQTTHPHDNSTNLVGTGSPAGIRYDSTYVP